MRSSPRLSLFAILSGLVLATASAGAWVKTYHLSSDPEGWDISWNAGHYFSAYNQHVTSEIFSSPITNMIFNGRTASDTTGKTVKFEAGSIGVLWNTSAVTPDLPSKNSLDFYEVVFSASENVKSFTCYTKNGVTSGSGNFYLNSVTIFRVDPPPTLCSIEDRSIAVTAPLTNESLVVSSELNDDDDGIDDTITMAISAVVNGNALSAGYSAYERDGAWFYSFSPEEAGVDEGDVEITITPIGNGGTGVSQSFTITVLAAGSPPTVLPILDQDILALRTLTIPFTVLEPDGDDIWTNVVCCTAGVTGTYGRDANENFFYTPSLADAEIGTINFRIDATDAQDTGSTTFDVYVTAGMPPALDPIAPQTIAYDGTNKVTLALTLTDGDSITATNVEVKAGTTAPVGERTFSDLVFRFVPEAADIGQTFIFTASATDFDGTTNVDFNVEVILAAPVLKHCPVDDWTATSFTADIKSAVPGATSYRLRHVHAEANDTVVTGYVDIVSFPYVVSGLDSTTYTYAIQAQCGAINSAWSNEETVHLENYLPPTYAIPMTGVAHGTYKETFNGLISSGSAYWYDARTIPGWYIAKWGASFSDGEYSAVDSPKTWTGVFSVKEDSVENRSLCIRPDDQDEKYHIAILFTNICSYAVTNLHVSYLGKQYRRLANATKFEFSYAKADSLVKAAVDTGFSFTRVKELDYVTPVTGSAAYFTPASNKVVAADISLSGDAALKPGEMVFLRWYVNAKNNYIPAGIDDVTVSWECAWPRHTVIYLR